jgi:colanic acid/amylovoran biosynthesis glycosyltransferase
MELQRNRIAMVSPSQDAYSESFIQSQKNGLEGKVLYYYGGNLPTYLEGYGKLQRRKNLLLGKIKKKIGLTTFSRYELDFIDSLKHNQIQVVLAQYGTTANRIVKICKHLNIPLITHFHGYDASKYTVIKDCNSYENVFAYSSYVIAVSNSMKEKLFQLGCPKEKLVYNTYGPQPSFLEIQPQFSEETFIALGRFVEKKAPYYTILAFSKVLMQFPNARLIIGGKGELFEVCYNLIRYLKIENSVSLPGILTKEQFENYLTSSLAFVQHSITALSGDQEGTPVVVLEASAAGLPVISTYHAGIPDVILDGVTGLLVEEHNVDAMTEKMLQLLNNREFAIQMGKNGKDRIQSHYTMDRHLKTIDKLINDVLKNE